MTKITHKKMNKFITIELLKLFIFTFVVYLFIITCEKRNELLANQFILTQSDLIYHNKSYFKNNNNQCPVYSNKLDGVFQVDIYDIPTFNYLKEINPNLQSGGFYRPNDCIQRDKLAIIIPYRDRLDNLKLLLKYLHAMLQKQLRYYRIFLVEQYGNDIFNKGRIMNIAYNEAMKLDDFDCFVFHDVDLIPENDFNLYECYTQPRHLSPAVDELRYSLMYNNLVGGVLALNIEQLIITNGFSNLYWGWGAEDDDMSMRILNAGYKITRPTNKIGRYKMVLHNKRIRAINR